MQETLEMPALELELMLQIQPEESLEWQAERNGQYTGWHILESAEQLVGLAQSISLRDDWFCVQTRTSGASCPGRYAQVMNTGSGFLMEVAQMQSSATYNWRIGVGPASDDHGNEPRRGVRDSQMISLAGVIEVLMSWLHGRGLPLGYGAALRVYYV